MPEHILVINKRHLGDVLLSTAALKLLRRTRPEARITVLAPAPYLPLLHDPAVVDEVIADPEPSRKLIRSLYKTGNALRHRFRRYDVCFFLGESATNARRIRLLSGIPERVCAATNLNGRPHGPASSCTRVIPAGSVWDTHVAECFQNVVRGYYGVTGRESTYAASAPGEQDPRAALLHACNGKKIALCFEGSSGLSSWPEASWIALLRRLHEQGHCLFTLFPPSQQSTVERLLAASGVPVYAWPTTLPQCADLLRRADLLIAVDTGQVHLAAALGVPVLSLAGNTTTGTFPYTPRGTALATAPHCFDCPFISRCPSNRKTGRTHAPGYVPPCMEHLPVEAVHRLAERLLEDPICNEPYIIMPQK